MKPFTNRLSRSWIRLHHEAATSHKPFLHTLKAFAAITILLVSMLGIVVAEPRVAHAAEGEWTQTVWTTPSSSLSVQLSNTTQFFRPTTAGFGVLTGTFGVCAGSGLWCQGTSDSSPGETLRLSGNWRTDNGNIYSSDLNGDNIPELLFANFWDNVSTHTFNGGWIYWGQGSPTSPNWSAAARSALPTIGAHGVVAADLNGDGLPEVLLTNHYNGSTYNLNSYIYWGQPGGTYGVTYTVSARTDLPALGPHGVGVADLNRDGRPEIILANHRDDSGYIINSYIYWGQAGGPHGVTYSTAARTSLPTIGATGVSVADLNSDGFPEIIFSNTYNGSTHVLNSYIYWGQPGGTYGVQYSTSARTELPTLGAYVSAIADLNADGRTDIVFANQRDASGFNVSSYAYWGQAGGPYGITYTVSARTNLPGVGAHRANVADLNNDGQRDVVLMNYHGGFARVFWGAIPTTGTATISWTLPITFGFRGLSLSDLNGDGRVDMLTGRQGINSVTAYGTGGTSGRVYLHNSNNSAPYNTTPNFDLPVLSSPSAYASFKAGRGTNGDWFGQPRAVYGTSFPTFGVLESQIIDSGASGTAWHMLTTTAQISPGTGITLFMAVNDNPAALTNPGWYPVGAIGNGTVTNTIGALSGRYARYRLVLWRDRTTEASPALERISFGYLTVPSQSGFNKQAPANGATGQPINGLTLSWTSVADATYYLVCHRTTPGAPCNIWNWDSMVYTTSVTLNNLIPNATYEWQVLACNMAGCNDGADNGTRWTFTTISAPGSFSKSSPANGATGQSLNPTLSWNPASGTVDHYRYCVDTSTGCTPNINVGTNTSVNLSSLTPGVTYYWQVRACADSSCSVFTNANGGQHWSFTTSAPVSGFNKFMPGNNAFNVNPATTQLTWAAASGASDYLVCVGTGINTCDIVGGGPGVYSSTGTSQSLPLGGLGLQPNTTYYWQVKATNGTYTTFANGATLAFWSFTTLPNGPDPFNKVGPSFNATGVPTQSITFNWQPSNGAVSYTLCIGAFPGDCSLSVVTNGTNAVLPGPLPAGATLFWQVIAHNAGGSTSADNGQWQPFTTMPNAPQNFSKLNPTGNAVDQSLGLSLSWQDTPDETGYRVCVGTSIGLCNIISTTTAANVTALNISSLDFGTQYYWQVSACNLGGCTPANDGVFWTFKTSNPPSPGPFQKLMPANGLNNQPVNPADILLQWTASQEASGYEICLGTQPNTCDLSGGGFQDIGAVQQITLAQLPFSVTLQPATTYYWQVRAYNALTATRTFANNGIDFFFTTQNVSGPGMFSKDAPVNGTFNMPTSSLTLRWFPASGATSYEICVGTMPGSCDALPMNTWRNVGNALTATVSQLSPATTYWWQVRALNSAGVVMANGGAWWHFTTRNEGFPSGFSKVASPQLSTGQLTATLVLSWYASTGANGYQVCIGSAPGLCDVSAGWVDVGNATSWVVTPPLQGGTTYWWQVAALGPGFSVQADNGQWWPFTTGADNTNAPDAFRKLTPVQGASERPFSGLTLTWQAAAGATGYQVCIGSQHGSCDVTGNWVDVGNVTSWNPPALNPSRTYWWQVRAVNTHGQVQSDSGQWWYFTTKPGSGAPGEFTKNEPANNLPDNPTGMLLSWTEAPGATSYRVCIGLLPGDCSVTNGDWVSVPGTTYPISGLPYDTTYWWQVLAVNDDGQTLADDGIWWTFSTGNDPASTLGAFGKTQSPDTTTSVPTTGTLSWTPSANADSYRVCVGTQPGLCDVINNAVVTGTSLPLTNTQPGQTYWWQVWAEGNGQSLQADDGEWWAFTTSNGTNGPAAFGKQSPADAALVGSLVTLQWQTTNATEYRICVGTDWGLCDVVNNVRLNSSGFTINSLQSSLSYSLPRLRPGSYWWQVTAYDVLSNATQADSGVRWQFIVLNDGIGNLDTTGATGSRKEVTPTVVRMGGVVNYTIVLSNSGSVPVTARVTDTLQTQATLLSATPGYTQSGQTLVWSNIVVPAGGTATITMTVRAGSGPLPSGYTLNNTAIIGAHDGQITREAPPVKVEPYRAYIPISRRP